LTFKWVCELGLKLDSTQDETSRAGFQRRLCMLAATCFSTFDVSSEYLPTILSSDEDFSIAMQCAVIVYDNTPPALSDDSSISLARMLSRHRRLLHDLEPIFSQPAPAVLARARLLHSSAYDQALSHLWLGYRQRSFSSWYALPTPNSRWIFCVAGGGQEVHYDLLTGQLFIGGKRLGRLPQEIMDHPTYASILGSVSVQS